MSGKIKILVADDEKRLLDLMYDILSGQGYVVTVVNDGEEAIEKFYEDEDYDLVILDVMMPRTDGWEACRVIREHSKVPIIMLTALGDDKNEIKGLNNGANDYISKPFSYEILLARIKVLLRDKVGGAGEKINYERLVLDDESHEVTNDNETVDLRPKEYELLRYFIKNKGRALSRSQILDHVWGFDYFGDVRTVDTHVKSLRAKIGDYGDDIKTVRGIGYKLR